MTKEEYTKYQINLIDGRDENIIRFIANFRFHQSLADDIYLNDTSEEVIYQQFSAGYCYHFAIILSAMFPGGQICVAAPFGHIVYVYNHVAYDIDGISGIESNCFIPVSFLDKNTLNDFTHIPGEEPNLKDMPDIREIMIRWMKYVLIDKENEVVYALTSNEPFRKKNETLDDRLESDKKKTLEWMLNELCNHLRKVEGKTHEECKMLRKSVLQE